MSIHNKDVTDMLISRVVNKFELWVRNSFRSVHFRHLIPDIVIVSASIYGSLFLRVGFGTDEADAFIDPLHKFAPFILGIRILVYIFSGCYTILWRYVSTTDVLRMTRATAAGSAIIISLSFFLPEDFGRIPRSLYLIETVLSLMLLLGVRIVRRVKFESRHIEQIRHGKRTLIYGAGYNGKTLADRFAYDVNEATCLIGFIDDDPKRQGISIAGTKVLGNLNNLSELIMSYSITNVIIASTNIPGEKIRRVLEETRPFNIKPRIISGRLTDQHDQDPTHVREVNLSDLLNRTVTNVEIKSIDQMVRGKRVLVTGAGGSIGSEIARQVLAQNPGRLILLDHSEFNLYQIDSELRTSSVDIDRVTPLLLNLRDRETLTNRLRELAPQVVIHAAAYKHVHLVESNPFSAILNNVEGALNLLRFCEEHSVDRFVLVSTDKAVNPAGVMGATKRICELMVSSSGKKYSKKFCSVRFGNVLGSSGSLIPKLKGQILKGGPVTVTHSEMTRYFMLIPEAVSLVLKAATIARPGDINVLKMGDPVKILDIAKNLISFMGRKESEIEIMFTGLRPGEKMYEELYLRGDELKTEHPDILTLPDGDMNFDNNDQGYESLFEKVEKMIDFAKEADSEALYLLNQLVESTYVPPDHIKSESEKVSKLIGPNYKLH